MTLFTTLLVLIAERLFKLGEHWQLDHRLEVAFRRIKHFSLPGTLLMTLVAVAVVYIIQRLLQGSCLTYRCWCSGFYWACYALAPAKFGCTTMPI
ncbi:AmpE protein [Klebsiella pneumoniae]|nr:AmpE protein [Klebsiella pneumoniae]